MHATSIPSPQLSPEQGIRRSLAPGQRGMSLIEILVVLAIIALLSSGVAILALNAWKRAQRKVASKEIAALSQALETFQLERGRCPSDANELVTAGIIKQLSADPWGTAYALACPGERAEFEIASAGEDREFDTEDDINSWQLGSAAAP